MLMEVKEESREDRASLGKMEEERVKEAPIKGRKVKGIWKKARRGENFSEKILWIEKLSLCLQCLNKWRLSSEKSWEPQKKRGYL